MPDIFVDNQNEKRSNEPIQGSGVSLSAQQEHLGNKPSLFTSYCPNPIGVRIEKTDPDEKIVLFIRRHFITNLQWISVGSIFIVLPLFLVIFPNLIGSINSILPLRFFIIFLIFYYLIIIGYLLLNFISWFYNVGILTTKKIIDVDFNDLLSRNIASALIQDIKDVDFEESGLLSNFFDYGNVHMQTETEKQNFEFLQIPHPAKVADTLLDLISQARKSDNSN